VSGMYWTSTPDGSTGLPPHTIEVMTGVSFSTMWAQQARFADLSRFSDSVAEFGYDAIEVSHSTDEDGLRTLLRPGGLPISSLHAPTPHRRLANGRRNGDANLASTDSVQRLTALDEHKRTIDIAADAGLAYVVVHLGGVGDERSDLETHLRALYESGVREGPAWTEAQNALCKWREQACPPYFEAAKHSLEALLEYAARRGVALGLESRLSYNEFPHPDEALELLEPYDNTVAGFWYDTGHCEVQARLGMIPRDLWFPRLTPRMIGCHLHDVDGLLDHRAPGNGSLDWSYVAAALPPDALRVLEINQFEPDDLVAGAIAFLSDRGVIARQRRFV
jgi:sugar phosphate isomerase/epimerase